MAIIKQYLRLNLADFPLMASIPAGGLALLELCHALGNGFSSDHAILYLGDLIFPLIAGGLAVFATAGHVLSTYEQSIKLGRTRRETVSCVLVLCLLESAFVFAAAGVCSWVEGLLGDYLWPALYPDALPEIAFRDIFPLWGQAAAIVVCTLAGLAMGALLHRFGRKAFWVIWGVWMAFFLGMSSINHDWVDRIIRAAGIGLLPVLLCASGVLLAGLFLWSLWYLLHMAVKT